MSGYFTQQNLSFRNLLILLGGMVFAFKQLSAPLWEALDGWWTDGFPLLHS